MSKEALEHGPAPTDNGRKHFWSIFSLIVVWAICLVPVTSPHLNHLVFPAGAYPFGNWVSTRFWNQIYLVLTGVLLIFPMGKLLRSEATWRPNIWRLLDACILVFAVVTTFKLLTHAPRPGGDPSGFISGHTAFAISLAYLVKESYPRLAGLWFCMAIVVAWSRIEAHAHFPYQVALGEILGLAIGWAVTQTSQGVIFPRIVPGWFQRKRRSVIGPAGPRS